MECKYCCSCCVEKSLDYFNSYTVKTTKYPSRTHSYEICKECEQDQEEKKNHKKCQVCGIIKHNDDFSKEVKSRCKLCKTKIKSINDKNSISSDPEKKVRKSATDKKWSVKNADRKKTVNDLWRENNADHIKDYKQEHKDEHREKYKPKKREWEQYQRENNPQYKPKMNARNSINRLHLQKDKDKHRPLVDCNVRHWVEWIEFQFDSNMSWENRGKYWTYDHVIPCSEYDK